MNRHQVLTGAANSGDQCFAVGSVEGVHFTAYAAGCDIVILASDFQRVQIIPGATHGNIQVGCVDCCEDSGKVAASYGHSVFIFEPTPLLHHDSSHRLDYQWYQTGTITAAFEVLALSWNIDGSRLLTAGDVIQMWRCPEHADEEPEPQCNGGVAFQLGEETSLLDWDCLWQCRTATTVYHIQFSPDGLLFASVGKADRLIKIWYENKKVQLSQLPRLDSVCSPRKQTLSYNFVYVAHPRAVTGFSWRKTSKYMPVGSVANMLITSCKDGICRLWCETIVPDDGLIDLHQLDVPGVQNPKYHTIRYRDRFLQRLKYVKQSIDNRRRRQSGQSSGSMIPPQLPSLHSAHDVHKYCVNANGLAPLLHFHLSASINPENDVPVMPIVGRNDINEQGFVVHWLNNKELQFTLEAERIVQELAKKALIDDNDASSFDEISYQVPQEGSVFDVVGSDGDESGITHKAFKGITIDSEPSDSTHSSRSESALIAAEVTGESVADGLDIRIEKLLQEWHQNPDMLFCVRPADGSFLVWLVEWLDEYIPCSFRQATISFSSCIPQCLPVCDAMTMSTNLKLYSNHVKFDVKDGLKLDHRKQDLISTPNYSANAMGKNSPGQSDNRLIPNIIMLSKHLNGTLNQWQITFAENSKFAMVLNVAHASRACGHRFRTNNASCHPVLPLLLSTSHHNIPPTEFKTLGSSSGCCAPGFCSELILWRVEPVGPLSKSGGITELARINSPEISAFANVSWIPTLLPSSILGSFSNSPSALFVASDGQSLRVYQAVIDARTILAEAGLHAKKKKVPTATLR